MTALRLATALPSGVRGPVDFLALRRLAAICFSLVDIRLSFYRLSRTVFCGDVVGKVCGDLPNSAVGLETHPDPAGMGHAANFGS